MIGFKLHKNVSNVKISIRTLVACSKERTKYLHDTIIDIIIYYILHKYDCICTYYLLVPMQYVCRSRGVYNNMYESIMILALRAWIVIIIIIIIIQSGHMKYYTLLNKTDYHRYIE